MKHIIRNIFIIFIAATSLNAYAQQYKIVGITGSKQYLDNRFDRNPDTAVISIINRYKNTVDREMSDIVGYSDKNMHSDRPEGLLNDCTADILLTESRLFDKTVAAVFINVGGLRSPIHKGAITRGDVYKLFPFQNTLCLMTLKGSDLRSLLKEIAHRNGEGISGINMVITRDHQLVSARIKNADLDDNASYRIATIDYLAEGNDGMPSFRKGTNRIFPDNALLRDLMINYLRTLKKENIHLNPHLDGRITIKK